MRRREFLKWAGAGAAALLVPPGCSSNGSGTPDGSSSNPDASRAGLDAASERPDAGQPMPKTLHYFTQWSAPEARVRVGSGTEPVALATEEPGTLVRGEVGLVGEETLLFLRDPATGDEDHPPRAADYRIPADVEEAWIWKGAVFDVDPRRLTVDLIDAHTHPYDRAADGSLVAAAGPLLAVERAGTCIGMALTMVKGPLADQRALLVPLCRDNPWLVPLAWIEPTRDSAADAEAMLVEHGFKGLKFHPTISAYDADGPLLDPFLEVARKHRVPVQLHCATDAHATPERLAALAKRFPDVNLVMIHTELGSDDKRHALGLVQSLPNVYAETSWTSPDGALLAMQMLDSSRTLFGTDATVDGRAQFTKTSVSDGHGGWITIPEAVSRIRAGAHPDAYANWARLTAIRLYDLRFKRLV
ncbi:MAG: amidohydrolase family protein [Myxococcales bacterium]